MRNSSVHYHRCYWAFLQYGAVAGWGYPTGVLLLLALLLLLAGAVPALRCKGWFELFFWSHQARSVSKASII